MTAMLDTNVLVYAFSDDPRAEAAERLLASGCLVGVQGLNEFANVARRKLGLSWAEIREAVTDIRALCGEAVPLDGDTLAAALDVAERHRLGFYDSLMIAAALGAGCDTLWSEDMQHGLSIGGRLRIVDPFRPE